MTRFRVGLANWLALGAVFTGLSCSRPGLVRDKYSTDFYRIPKKLDTNRLEGPTRFIIYGDNRPGWRVKEKFVRRKAWLTWKQLIIPFYQLYWLGNGLTGAFNGLRNAPDNGGREARWVRDAIYERAKTSRVDFIVNAGDIVADGRYPKNWETFLRQYKEDVPVVTEIPFLPVVGNHEHANDSIYAMPNYRDVFSYPPFYVIRCRDADLFMIDSNLILDSEGYIDDDTQDALFRKWFVSGGEPAEPAWLEQKLSSSTQKFKIVIMHHPPIAFARHFGDWLNPGNGRELLAKRRAFLGLLEDEGVQVVFTGHAHMYEHSKLTYDRGDGRTAELHTMITGGGGSPLQEGYSADQVAGLRDRYKSMGLDAALLRQDLIYNYCLVDVTPEEMTIRVFEVSGRAETNGRLVDTVVVEAVDGGQ